jgi:hypothetical protein
MLFRHTLVASLLAGVGVASMAGFAPSPAASPLAPVTSARADDHEAYQKIIDGAGPALVTVKFVMKSPNDQGAGDSEEEINGIVIDPKGLVLCSYWSIGGAYARFAPGGAAPKPQDVRVLIGDDTEGKKARLISHDSELDLAWIKLDEEPATPLKSLSLDAGAEGKVGERIFLLSRMDKFFGRAQIINEGRVRGVATTPRRLYAPSNTLLAGPSDLGMAIFNEDAAPIGFIIVQIPDQESMDAAQNMGGGPMILPIAEVAKATKRALEAAAAEPAPEAAPAAGATPAEPKKD